jgi:SH3-like domain-containing protein
MDSTIRGRAGVGMPTAARAAALVAAALTWSIVAGGVSSPAAEPDANAAPLPGTVAVRSPQALLRAGPGDDFYPTERLSAGATVEIWAIDSSGYCAVRPVRGSFSWLRSSEVADDAGRTAAGRPRGRFTGVVAGDGVVARVGSQLNDLRHVGQVKLEAGERVAVIEEVVIPTGRHAGMWLRIEPPSGEFRWVSGTDVELPASLAVEVEPAADAAGLAAAGEAAAAFREAGGVIRQVVAEMTAPGDPPGLQGDPASGPAAPPAEPRSGWLPRGAGVFDRPTPVGQAASGPTGAGVSDAELADIDLALSLTVTGPSESWNLAPIRERLRQVAARADSESDRTRVQALDTRLSRFEAIQGRQRSLVAAPPAETSPLRLGSMWSSLGALGSRPIRPGVLPGGGSADGRPTWTPPEQMETTGRLATVVARRPDAPRWALVDEQNNVLVFVTPQAGVNIAPLVGQQVTVRGARGYMPEYSRPYLVASEARTRIAAAPPTPRADATR